MKVETGSDRRRWQRLDRELHLQVQVLGGGQDIIPAVGSHLNPEGVFVQMASPPPMGTRVRISVAAEGTDGVLTVEGEVVDRVEAGDGQGPAGIGLRLPEPGPEWEQLYRYLSDV